MAAAAVIRNKGESDIAVIDIGRRRKGRAKLKGRAMATAAVISNKRKSEIAVIDVGRGEDDGGGVAIWMTSMAIWKRRANGWRW
jgi:hypothetical protein